MFKAPIFYNSFKTVLYRYSAKSVNSHIVSANHYCVYKGPETREKCPVPPPPPPPPPRDDKLLWGTLAALIVAGFGIVMAKSSPEVRDWITIYCPWLDDFIAIVYEENMSHKDFVQSCWTDLNKYVKKYRKDELKRISDGKPVEDEEAACDPEEDERPPPVYDICEFDNNINDVGDFMLNNYYTAKQACIYYNGLVQETMQGRFTPAAMQMLEDAMVERKMLIKESLDNVDNSIQRLDQMLKYLEGSVKPCKSAVDKTKKLLKFYKDKGVAAKAEFEWENDMSIALDRQKEIVQATVEKYVFENQSVYPGLSFLAEKPSISGDTDILLYNTLRYVNQLNLELEEALDAIADRTNRAVATVLGTDPAVLKKKESEIQALYNKKKSAMEVDILKRFDEQRAKNEATAKQILEKQLKKHEETLEIRVNQREQEVMAKFDSMVNEKVAVEKRVFDKSLSEMAFKLKIVEDQLEVRLKAERDARRSQELWAAASKLLAATRKGDPCIDVNSELNSIEKISGGEDQLVTTVLSSIPPTVRERGIVPESVLREKYKAMESAALKVSLLEEDGGTMPVYILSWLQSLLLFMKISGIPQEEFEKPPKEPPEHLDTFDLLQRARFWLQHGNLANALRYVNNLQGASRLAAQTWYDTAKEHLEVRQAAEAILAHAAAMGLQYL